MSSSRRAPVISSWRSRSSARRSSISGRGTEPSSPAAYVPSSWLYAKKPHQSSCAASTKSSSRSWSSSVSPG